MIRLIPYGDEHYEVLRGWLSAPELRPYFRRYPPCGTWLSQASARQTFANTFLVEKDGALAGCVTLANVDLQARRAEFGVALVPQSGRREIAVEAFRQLFSYAFDYVGLNKLYCNLLTDRADLHPILEHYKFQREGTLREHTFFDGRFHSEDQFSLLRSDYLTIEDR